MNSTISPDPGPGVNVHAHDAPRSAWVRRFLPLVAPGGRVLDLAADAGRHTALLLDQGFSVIAADRKTTALQARFGAHPRCAIRELDLENGEPWRLGGGFDGILVSLYLHRPLFPDLAAALAPGGVLIYETFMRGNERFGRPTNPDFLLKPDELFAVFSRDLRVIAFEQGEVAEPKPAMMQRIAAVKGEMPKLP
ncbi:MAG TPA: SAM-dependent methyltransferase [Stellaceae bacterium]|jgi:SAM-dependent methyltransferase|nr:SAM-dependent methyltransferase [Stellaceae bacterium]